VGDVFFVIATGIDVGLSYTYIFGTFTIKLSKLGIASAFFWLTASLVYVAVTLYSKKHDTMDNHDVVSGKRIESLEKKSVEESREWNDDELSFDSL
jgi:hypothetical protein